jgi:glycerate kinase
MNYKIRHWCGMPAALAVPMCAIAGQVRDSSGGCRAGWTKAGAKLELLRLGSGMGSAASPRRLLVAFDKFKGALDARAACDVVAETIERERPGWLVDRAPLTDGGDGFCSIITLAAGGELQPRSASGPFVMAPEATRVQASIGIVELARVPERARELLDLPDDVQKLGVIEMASVSGLALVPPGRRDIWRSSSRGTGELLLEAARAGVDAILLGVGGSASSDLGLGALEALGLRCHTTGGSEVSPSTPVRWPEVMSIAGRVARLPPLRIACDVDNPVFGERGAAAVYGPQKGLKAADLSAFDASARRMAELLCASLGVGTDAFDVPGAGAAGGIAFGLVVAAGARLVPGSRLLEAWLGLEARVLAADWVLTGEGRFDASSWSGKGPGAVVELALRQSRPCAVFAGSIGREPRRPNGAERGSKDARSSQGRAKDGGSRLQAAPELIAISPPGEPLSRSLADTRENLARSIRSWLGRIDPGAPGDGAAQKR